MKKISRFSIIVLAVLLVTLITISTVFATSSAAANSVTWDNPTATSTRAGAKITGTILDLWQLPGTEVSGDGMYLPANFNGDAQFGGKGIQLSDLSEGNTATLCFPFPVYNNSWAGKIYKWNDPNWTSISTSILTNANGSTSACTYRAGSGTYSLLISFYGTPDVPTPTASSSWKDPTASATKADEKYFSSALDQWQLPGSEVISSGMYLPTGFNGQAQFGGKGIEISGLSEGSVVKVCFDFPVYKKSWSGKIYSWSDSKWNPVSTTFVSNPHSNSNSACTYKAGNGIYSLIMGYSG